MRLRLSPNLVLLSDENREALRWGPLCLPRFARMARRLDLVERRAADAGTAADSDTGPLTDCFGQSDFTLCETLRDPDRSYDICINGDCVSPGCGDANCNEPGPSFTLSDTNQRKCYDDESEITCPSAGDDDYGQDAQYGWDTVNAEEDRFTRDTSHSEGPVVTDNVAGLVWQGCAAGLTDDGCDSPSAVKYYWKPALAYCDDLTWGGYSDWRLPNKNELRSITNEHLSDVPIDENAFPETPENIFWSSSTDWMSSAWVVGFSNEGSSLDYYAKTNEYCMRCVRDVL